jgi:hypothetical protein
VREYRKGFSGEWLRGNKRIKYDSAVEEELS